jgi:hypothetical protein
MEGIMPGITVKLRKQFPKTLLKIQAADYIEELEKRLSFSENTLRRLARRELTAERSGPNKIRLTPAGNKRIKELEKALEGLLPYAHTGAIVRDVDPTEQPQFVAAYLALKGDK